MFEKHNTFKEGSTLIMVVCPVCHTELRNAHSVLIHLAEYISTIGR